MNKLLVVEDEVITSDLLRRYFEIVGYEVVNAQTGGDALKLAIEHHPKVIILDIMLPDMDGYEVCRKLRSNKETDGIPIIFLTQKDDRRDKLEGLELGADDYLTKPFDVEELRLRVHNIIGRAGGTPLVDPRTSLPNMALIKERLPKLVDDPNSAFFDVELQHYAPFEKQYGPVAANQVIRSAAKVIGDLLHEIDPKQTFIGHPRDDHFLLVVPKGAIARVDKDLPARFGELVVKFYDVPDQERGKMKLAGSDDVPFMAFKLTQVKAEMLRLLMTGAAERPRPPAKDAKQPTSKPEALPAPPDPKRLAAPKEAPAPVPEATQETPSKGRPELKIVVDNTRKNAVNNKKPEEGEKAEEKKED